MGLHSILPLGVRITDKIEAIINSELESINCQRLRMPIVLPKELWTTSGRWGGSEMFTLSDRHGSDYCLAPTHEEAFVSITKENLSSKRLPLRLYQIGDKFRDEVRPRMGLLRSREFRMKDLYTFDVDKPSALDTYDQVSEAYSRIFKRIGVEVVKVQADSGEIGGDHSHEYHVVTDIGEDKLFVCSNCRDAANVEKAVAVVETLSADHEVSGVKVKCASEAFVVTRGDGSKVLVVIPKGRRVRLSHFGMNSTIVEHNGEWDGDVAVDANCGPGDEYLVEAEHGDKCVSCSGELTQYAGIEVGHVFYLGTKYSEPFDCGFNIGDTRVLCEMGCYGIGVSRLLTGIAQVHHDASGLKWPVNIAPYKVAFVTNGSATSEETLKDLYSVLETVPGFSDELIVVDPELGSLGKRMKMAAAIGIPYTIIIGNSFAKEGKFEIEIRKTGEKKFLSQEQLLSYFQDI